MEAFVWELPTKENAFAGAEEGGEVAEVPHALVGLFLAMAAPQETPPTQWAMQLSILRR